MKSVSFDLGPSLHKDYLKWGRVGVPQKGLQNCRCFPTSLYFVGFSVFLLEQIFLFKGISFCNDKAMKIFSVFL